MLRRTLSFFAATLLFLSFSLPAAAQSPTGEPVTIEASDGLTLAGLYYAPIDPPEGGAPATLLMHHSGSQKEAWIDLIPVLHDAGYAVLTVDLRGHGETGGDVDWTLGEEDALAWLSWLRDRPEVDPARVSIVGASIGADVGLRVMARDESVATLVGLSVGLNVQGVDTAEAVEAIGARPLYLSAGGRVTEEAEAVRTLFGLAQGDVQARLFDNSACCTFLLMLERDLGDSIVAWLDTYGGPH